MNLARITELAWSVAGRLPVPVAETVFGVVADLAWLRHGEKVRRLEANLARVRPGSSRHILRRWSRAGMRSYMQYYCEVFRLERLTTEQILAKVRCEGLEHIQRYTEQGMAVPLVLGHLANWDLAGAWANLVISPVTAAAERLKPEELYQRFVRTRGDVGITVVPLDHNGSEVFRELIRIVNAGGPRVVPLLADRDLSASGVEVDFFGERARMAPGPAALSLATKMPLVPTMMHYERLRGERRKAAGSRWGMVVTFHPAVPHPDSGSQREKVAVMTQHWARTLQSAIERSPADWHMMARVFVADLDPKRDAAVRAVGETGS